MNFNGRLAFVLAISFVSFVLADTIIVTVKGPKNQVTSPVIVNPAATITNINCTPGTVTEGDMVSCAVVIDRPAPSPFGLKLSVFNVPGVDSILIPPGLTAVTFNFQAAIPPPSVSPAKAIPPPAAGYRPLPMPMHNGPALGLSTDYFIAMFYYYLEPPAAR